MVNLTRIERDECGIKLIEAVDEPAEIRRERKAAAKREKNRMAQEASRRKRGMIRRAEYEGKSLSRTQPWKATGKSRATYYRSLAAGKLSIAAE
jgi:hypothetical protein